MNSDDLLHAAEVATDSADYRLNTARDNDLSDALASAIAALNALRGAMKIQAAQIAKLQADNQMLFKDYNP